LVRGAGEAGGEALAFPLGLARTGFCTMGALNVKPTKWNVRRRFFFAALPATSTSVRSSSSSAVRQWEGGERERENDKGDGRDLL
jgi:hypothetical protein